MKNPEFNSVENKKESDLIASENYQKGIDSLLLAETIYNEKEKAVRRENFEIAWGKRWQIEGELGHFQTRENESPFSQYDSRGWEIHIAFEKEKEQEVARFLYENGLYFIVEAGYGTYFNCIEESGATIHVGSNNNMTEVTKIIEANIGKFLKDGAIAKVGDKTVHMGSSSDIEVYPKITARFNVDRTKFGQMEGNKKYAEYGLPAWTELGGIPILAKYKEEVYDITLISEWNKYTPDQKKFYYEKRLKPIYEESKKELMKDFKEEFLFGDKVDNIESDIIAPDCLREEVKRVWQKEEIEKPDSALKISKETTAREKTIEKLEKFLEKAKKRKQTVEKEQQKEKEAKEINEEKFLVAADKQAEKIEKEIKQEKSWIREKVEKTADWYKKQPLKYKILLSLGCVGAASASAAIGGSVGVAIATAAFTGSIGQRIFGGLATFVTVEGLLKKSAEKGGRERSKWEARRHTVEAAILGALIGSGKLAEGIKNIAEATDIKNFLREAYQYWLPKEEVGKLISEIEIPVEQISQEIGEAPIQQEISVASTIEIKPEFLTIGEQGPEGTIINYFKSNLESAKLFGWDGETNLTEWAGKKAHLLWLENAKESLIKPEIIEQLKKLGYSANIEGYAKMMHRIDNGFVELNIKTGKINLTDIKYFKSKY